MGITGVRRISTPVVLASRGSLSVVPEAGLRVLGIVLTPGGGMLRKASAKKSAIETPGWILESNGLFWEFSPVGRVNDWATPISPLIQLVKSKFSTTVPRSITVGELKQRLAPMRDKFREARQVAGLRRYLDTYSEDEIVSEKMLKDWPI